MCRLFERLSTRAQARTNRGLSNYDRPGGLQAKGSERVTQMDETTLRNLGCRISPFYAFREQSFVLKQRTTGFGRIRGIYSAYLLLLLTSFLNSYLLLDKMSQIIPSFK